MLDSARRRQRQLRLLDLYGSLLTDHQRRILHFAWELDWSYGEIAQREGVTRTAVYDVVRRTTTNLDDYERLLGDRVPMGYAPSPPTVIVLAGLQGSGKTTSAGKLALFTRREGHRPLLVSTDVRRPAAMEQLEILAKSINAPSYAPRGTDPVAIARESLAEARRVNADVVIVDTAGRLQVDEDLLAELKRITDAVPAQHRLLVLDAMTGQPA